MLLEPAFVPASKGPQRLRVLLLLGVLLVLGSAFLVLVRALWAAEPYSSWHTDAFGNEVIEDGFFYRPLGGTPSLNIAVGMLLAGAGLCAFALSRRHRWVGGLVALVLTWCLWAAIAMTTLALFAKLELNPDDWGWWVTFSDMFYEGAVARSVILALAALLASWTAIQIVRAGSGMFEGLLNRNRRAPEQ